MTLNLSKTATVTIVVLIAVVSIAPAGAAAQANETATETPTETPSNTAGAGGANQTEYQLEINDVTRIVDSSWDRGTVSFVIESDESQMIVITDSSIEMKKQAAGHVPQLRTAVPKGRTKLTFTVENPSDAVVTINSKTDLVWLSPGSGRDAIIGGDYTASDARAAGFGSAASLSLLTMFLVLRKIRSPQSEGDRIA